MVDGFSLSMLTAPTVDAMAAIQKRVDTASSDAVRQAGRLAQQVARAAAPVYGGRNSVRVTAVKKARRAGVTLTGEKLRPGQMVEGSKVVAGLLRSSITAGRPQKLSDGYRVKVLPRGPRVHLYAAKEEAREGYMAKAHAASVEAAREIHATAWAKAMER